MYAVNISTYNVGLMTGKYLIEVNDYQELRQGDEKHEEIQEAVRRKWIKLQATEPKDVEKKGPKIEITRPAAQGSLTIPKKVKEKAKA